MGEGRHFIAFESAHADKGNGAPDVIRSDDGYVIDAFITEHWPIDQMLLGKRSIVACIKTGACSVRAVTMRTVGIEVRTRALLQISRIIVALCKFRISRRGRFIQMRIEKADVIP